MEAWISIREFSRRRDVALSAVQKAIESGRVTSVRRDSNGRLEAIEFYAASAEWDRNTDPTQASRSGQGSGRDVGTAPSAGELIDQAVVGDAATPDAATQKSVGELKPGADKDPHGYLKARATREQFDAKNSELDYLRAIGQLVSSDEVRAIAQRRYRAIRDQMLAIPGREAAVLAAERDPARCEAILMKAIKRVLHELADDARSETTRGTAERVAA